MLLPMYLSLAVNSFSLEELREEIMEWPPSSPDLNLIENLWSIVKIKLYRGEKHYNSKAYLEYEIKIIISEMGPFKEKILKSEG